MDTSEQYIKMCEKAEEIQKLCSLEELTTSPNPEPYITTHLDSYFYINHPWRDTWTYKVIWLPRQDQLQDMVGQYYAEQDEMVFSSHYIKVAFLDFATWMGIQYRPKPFVCVPTNCFDSGGQLWLAFVMQEKYNKIWDGEDWSIATPKGKERNNE